MGLKAEAASPSQSTFVLEGIEGWRHLGRAAQQSEASRRRGLLRWRARTFVRLADRAPVQAAYDCLYPLISNRTRVPIPRIATRVR